MVLQTIFIVLGLTLFINALLEKWNIWDDIAQIGSRSSKEWIFKLTNCHFCVLSHICWIVTIFVGFIGGFSWSLLVVPFVVSGFIHLIRK